MGHYSKWVGGGELFDNAHLILGHEIKKPASNISSSYLMLSGNLFYVISWNEKVLTHSELEITWAEGFSVVK